MVDSIYDYFDVFAIFFVNPLCSFLSLLFNSVFFFPLFRRPSIWVNSSFPISPCVRLVSFCLWLRLLSVSSVVETSWRHLKAPNMIGAASWSFRSRLIDLSIEQTLFGQLLGMCSGPFASSCCTVIRSTACGSSVSEPSFLFYLFSPLPDARFFVDLLVFANKFIKQDAFKQLTASRTLCRV